MHQSRKESIFNAWLVRFKPIIMTTVTTILGVISIVLAIWFSSRGLLTFRACHHWKIAFFLDSVVTRLLPI
ncbi:hypothetical protein PRO82_001736 [Candidatus Protochlamydia amoebophila]|nr:hypothetical protein [Candidatus Protochlamydia amoebophila]